MQIVFQRVDVSNMGESALKGHPKSKEHVKKAPVNHPSDIENLFDVKKEIAEPFSVE